MSYEIVSLKKGLRIVDLLKEGLPLSLTEIKDKLDLSKTTTLRLLRTLQEMEYVLRVGNYYMVHPKQLSLPRQTRSFSRTCLRSIPDFGDKVKQSIYIGTLYDMTLRVEKVYDAEEQKLVLGAFAMPSLAHQSALGKAIIANLKEKEQLEFFSRISLEKATDQTFTDPYLFLQHLKAIKEQQYATDFEESHLNTHCIAVPVFFRNEVIASVGISDNKDKLTKNHKRHLAKLMKQASRKITNELTAYEHALHSYKG